MVLYVTLDDVAKARGFKSYVIGNPFQSTSLPKQILVGAAGYGLG